MNTDMIFIDGLGPRHLEMSYLSYLPPLAASLERDNYDFKILNVSLLKKYSIESILNELQEHEFKVIGMTTNAANILNVIKMCHALKERFPIKPIILGGPQGTYTDMQTFNDCECDVIIRHDGEDSLIEVLDCLLNENGQLADIDGITFRSGKNVVRNKERVVFRYNEQPTPQYAVYVDKKYWIQPKYVTDTDFDEFLQAVNISNNVFMTGRGCPYSCAFCVEGNIGRKFIYREAENVKKDLIYFLKTTKHSCIAIGDDTFTSSPQRVRELCEIFKDVQKTYPFRWFAEGRVDILSKYPELIKEMYDVGIYKLQIGVESGNQNVLNVYNKRITLEQIRIVAKEASKYKDLIVHGNVMMCNPNETYEEFVKSLDFIKELFSISDFVLDMAYGYLAPFAGTPIAEKHEEFNIEKLFDRFEFVRNGITDITCKPKSLSMSQVYNMYWTTHGVLTSYLRSNIFSCSKKTIDRRIKLINKYGLFYSSISWQKSFDSLNAFKNYKELINSELTKDCMTVNSLVDMCPVRIWELKYETKTNGYIYTSLSGTKRRLDNMKKYLWDQASGKSTIKEIFENMPKIDSEIVDLEDVISFYKMLENDLAIVLREC